MYLMSRSPPQLGHRQPPCTQPELLCAEGVYKDHLLTPLDPGNERTARQPWRGQLRLEVPKLQGPSALSQRTISLTVTDANKDI